MAAHQGRLIAGPGLDARRHLTNAASQVPNLVWAGLFFVLPAAIMLLYSFGRQDSLTSEVSFGWTLHNYDRIGDSIVVEALLRSLWISAVSTFICLLIAYPLAYFLAFRAGRLKPLLVALVVIPFLTSFVVRTYAWVGILDVNGTVNDVLVGLGIVDEPLKLVFNQLGIIVGIVYNYLPLMVLALFVVLDRVDPRVVEAARDLGAGPFSAFRRVIFPQALPGMVAGIILVGAPAAGEYVIPSILGGGKVLMFGNIIEQQFGSVFAWPYGAALALVLTMILLVAIVASVRLVGRHRLQQVEL